MKKLLLPLLALAALALPARAAIADLEAIKPDGFSRGVVLTVAGYDANRSTLADFPVLVRISETAISGFDYDDLYSPATGDDLCFVADDGTPLAFDIDTWDPTGTSLVWVKLPSMQNGTQFAMCYRSSKSGKNDICSENPFAGYVGVWHLNEGGKGEQDILDAGPNGLAAKSSTLSTNKTDGAIGGARQITTDLKRAKADNAIKVTATDAAIAALNTLGSDFSMSFWARPVGTLDANNNTGGIVYQGLIGRKAASGTEAWHIQIADAANKARLWTSQTSDKNFSASTMFNWTQGQWAKIDVVYTYTTSGNAAKITTYWNGVKKLDAVTVITYGQKQIWDSRAEAIAFYLEGMMNCEGAERDRYINIYLALISGANVCKDEPDNE